MAAIAHNPAFAKKVGVPQSVGMDFNKADKGKTFKKGGDIVRKLFKGTESVKEELAEAKAIKSGKISPMQYAKGEQSEKKMAKGGLAKYISPVKNSGNDRRGENTKIQKRGLTEGKIIVMKGGSI
jgi:hypothetical protein